MALILAVDLLLDFPFPPQAIPATPPYPLGEKLEIHHLARIIRMVADSAINTAMHASKELLGLTPADGHIGLWLASTDSFDKFIDLAQLHRVGNRVSLSQVSSFGRLPLEENAPLDDPDWLGRLELAPP